MILVLLSLIVIGLVLSMPSGGGQVRNRPRTLPPKPPAPQGPPRRRQ